MRDPLEASYRFCGEVARREAKNFYLTFLLLPRAQRRAMCALYAFMRHTDDLADEPGPLALKREALKEWREVLASQESSWPGHRALADSVERFAIPRVYLSEVIDGVTMDLQPAPFITFDELYAYCYRVASVVGLCCIHIWGYESREGHAEKLAEKCGIALQLTNILRDVGEDARMGRVYLPQEDLARFGVSAEDLAGDRPTPALHDLLAFQAERAHRYYDEASALGAMVSPIGQPVLRAIVGIYRALLDEVGRRDYDVLSSRVAVPSWKKALITLRSIVPCREPLTDRS